MACLSDIWSQFRLHLGLSLCTGLAYKVRRKRWKLPSAQESEGHLQVTPLRFFSLQPSLLQRGLRKMVIGQPLFHRELAESDGSHHHTDQNDRWACQQNTLSWANSIRIPRTAGSRVFILSDERLLATISFPSDSLKVMYMGSRSGDPPDTEGGNAVVSAKGGILDGP
uniref:Uncharacterized protein n=1 Tax=Coccidioides posadasii RMSCC 3488 TaxID=454284 RepID=A0A0J6EXP1_COCPO|nr:hypothetical protein CPAG_01677 [Coccidioides posadasii RMSCC 3488]